MRLIDWLYGGVVFALAALTSGCSGFELGAKAGLYRVDERSESQRTYRKSVPLKCYFVDCGSDVIEGS